MIDKPPNSQPDGYVYQRQPTGTVEYVQFDHFTTNKAPCEIGDYKVCFNQACTPHAANSVITIGADPATTHCSDATLPCNWIKIQLGFNTLENEEYFPYIRAESVDKTPELFKYVDTKEFLVRIECGASLLVSDNVDTSPAPETFTHSK